MLATPDTGHVRRLYRHQVYEPAEDSFLVLDALQQDIEVLQQVQPRVCIEIGPGSGVLSTFLSQLLSKHGFPSPVLIGVDNNSTACEASKITAAKNNVSNYDSVAGSLFKCIRKTFTSDVILFNPPYVPTPPEDVEWNEGTLASAWAGGINGSEVIIAFLKAFKLLENRNIRSEDPTSLELSRKIDPFNVRYYLEQLKNEGFHVVAVKTERRRNEVLTVLRITKRRFAESN